MATVFRLLVLLITLPLLLGMGSLQGSTSPEKIPIPARNYSAVFVDQLDITTECTEISIEGTTFLEGKKGEGTYTISFDKIERITFLMNAGKLTGVVKLRDGETSELLLNKSQKAYGHTKHGTFQIKLADLKKLVIRAGTQQ